MKTKLCVNNVADTTSNKDPLTHFVRPLLQLPWQKYQTSRQTITRATPPAISPTKRDVTSTRLPLSLSVDHYRLQWICEQCWTGCYKKQPPHYTGWFLFLKKNLILTINFRAQWNIVWFSVQILKWRLSNTLGCRPSIFSSCCALLNKWWNRFWKHLQHN